MLFRSPLVAALTRRHGSRAPDVLAEARTTADLGPHFGADLYGREVDYFKAQEWARNADDVLWRRTKAGLHLDMGQQAHLSRYISGRAEGL